MTRDYNPGCRQFYRKAASLSRGMPLFQTASQCTTNQGARLQRPSAYRPTGTPLVPLSKSSIFLPRTDRSSKSTIGSLKRAYLKQALSSFMFGTKNVQLYPIIEPEPFRIFMLLGHKPASQLEARQNLWEERMSAMACRVDDFQILI